MLLEFPRKAIVSTYMHIRHDLFLNLWYCFVALDRRSSGFFDLFWQWSNVKVASNAEISSNYVFIIFAFFKTTTFTLFFFNEGKRSAIPEYRIFLGKIFDSP